MFYFITKEPDNESFKQEVKLDDSILNFHVIRNMLDDCNININNTSDIESYDNEICLEWDKKLQHPKSFEFVYEICKYVIDNDITPDNYKIKIDNLNGCYEEIMEFFTELFQKYTGYENHEDYKPFYHSILKLCDKYNSDAKYEDCNICLLLLCTHYAYTYLNYN